MTKEHISLPEEDLRSLVTLDELPDSVKTQKRNIIKAIENCKILDPACGSGAFPMGLLAAFTRVLEKLAPTKNDTDLYTRKLKLIQNCIYGVDIQPIAIQISKLRCFISLLADDEIDEASPNRGIEPLPNLEMHFVAANSLIDLDEPVEGMLMVPKVEKLIENMRKIASDIFSVKKHAQKKSKQDQYTELRLELKRELSGALNVHDYDKVADWDPFNPMTSSSFFNPAWMFGIKDGFDIVIGNPPYGILNKKQNKTESIVVSEDELEYYKNTSYYEPARGGMINIFRLFILRSVRLLAQSGVFSEIFPLAFIGDKSIAPLRKYLFSKHQPVFIETFPERDDENKRVFKGVKMSVCILNMKNIAPSQDFFLRINDDRFVNLESPKTILSMNMINLLDQENLTIPLVGQKELEILVKIFRQSTLFKNVAKCNTGEIDMTFCKSAFSEKSTDAKMLKGAIIDRFTLRSKMSQGEIVYINEQRLKQIKPINTNVINSRRIVFQGITGVNEKRRLKGMIVQEAYCANSLNYLFIKKDIKLELILGIFNSRLFNFVFSKFSTNSNVNGYEVDSLPFPQKLNEADSLEISKLVISILQKKVKDEFCDTTDDEYKIDQIIYELYGLTTDEIFEIEKAFDNNSIVNRNNFNSKSKAIGLESISANADDARD